MDKKIHRDTPRLAEYWAEYFTGVEAAVGPRDATTIHNSKMDFHAGAISVLSMLYRAASISELGHPDIDDPTVEVLEALHQDLEAMQRAMEEDAGEDAAHVDLVVTGNETKH